MHKRALRKIYWQCYRVQSKFDPSIKIDQITPPHLRRIQPAQNLNFPVGRAFSQIVSSDEGAGVQVGKINHVNYAGTQGF